MIKHDFYVKITTTFFSYLNPVQFITFDRVYIEKSSNYTLQTREVDPFVDISSIFFIQQSSFLSEVTSV